jgi:hypothetical protein
MMKHKKRLVFVLKLTTQQQQKEEYKYITELDCYR